MDYTTGSLSSAQLTVLTQYPNQRFICKFTVSDSQFSITNKVVQGWIQYVGTNSAGHRIGLLEYALTRRFVDFDYVESNIPSNINETFNGPSTREFPVPEYILDSVIEIYNLNSGAIKNSSYEIFRIVFQDGSSIIIGGAGGAIGFQADGSDSIVISTLSGENPTMLPIQTDLNSLPDVTIRLEWKIGRYGEVCQCILQVIGNGTNICDPLLFTITKSGDGIIGAGNFMIMDNPITQNCYGTFAVVYSEQ